MRAAAPIARSRNSSAGCGRLPASIAETANRAISTSTSNRSISGSVVLRSSGRPPQMHTWRTRPASLVRREQIGEIVAEPRRDVVALARPVTFPSSSRNPHGRSRAATSAPPRINATHVRRFFQGDVGLDRVRNRDRPSRACNRGKGGGRCHHRPHPNAGVESAAAAPRPSAVADAAPHHDGLRHTIGGAGRRDVGPDAARRHAVVSQHPERFARMRFVRSRRHLHLVVLAGRAPDDDRRSLAAKRLPAPRRIRVQRRPHAERHARRCRRRVVRRIGRGVTTSTTRQATGVSSMPIRVRTQLPLSLSVRVGSGGSDAFL